MRSSSGEQLRDQSNIPEVPPSYEKKETSEEDDQGPNVKYLTEAQMTATLTSDSPDLSTWLLDGREKIRSAFSGSTRERVIHGGTELSTAAIFAWPVLTSRVATTSICPQHGADQTTVPCQDDGGHLTAFLLPSLCHLGLHDLCLHILISFLSPKWPPGKKVSRDSLGLLCRVNAESQAAVWLMEGLTSWPAERLLGEGDPQKAA